MARETAYKSPDFTFVEPPLVPSSGGVHPQAAVAWNELQSGLNTKASQTDIAMAIADLFFDVKLVGGITERRPAMEGAAEYFFTRFEVDMRQLAGGTWQTRRISDDDLLDEAGHSVSSFYDFKITGEGTFTIEFQSASQNPVIADNTLTLVVQRRPVLLRASVDLTGGGQIIFSNGARFATAPDGSWEGFNAAGISLYAGAKNFVTLKGNPLKGLAADRGNGVFDQNILTSDSLGDSQSISEAEYLAF